MAGVLIPSVTVFLVALPLAFRFAVIPAEIEKGLLFPMGMIPFAWGIWNVLHVALHGKVKLNVGWYGSVLSVFLIESGFLLARGLGLSIVTFRGAAEVIAPIAVAYYFLWRYLVSWLNRLLGVT